MADQAAKDLDKAIKVHLKAARDAISGKDFRSAVKCVQEGLALDADHYDALCTLGKAQYGGRNEAEAVEAYIKATGVDKARVTAYQGLAELYSSTEQLDKLCTTLKTLISLSEKDKTKLKDYKDRLAATEKTMAGPTDVLGGIGSGTGVPERKLSSQNKAPKKTVSAQRSAVARCGMVDCKTRMTDSNGFTCKACGVVTCVEHQFAIDHDCTGPPQKAKPAGKNVVKVVTKVAAPVSVSPKPKVVEVVEENPAALSSSLTANMQDISAGLDELMALQNNNVAKVLEALIGKVDIKNKKAPPTDRENAMMCIELMCERMGRRFEAYAVGMLPLMMQCVGDGRGGVSAAAYGALTTVSGRMDQHALPLIFPTLLQALDDRNSRVKETGLELIRQLSPRAPFQMGLAMPALFPKLQECVSDTHAGVVAMATKCLDEVAKVITQPETQKLMVNLKLAIMNPKNTVVCLDQLMETTFVNSVDAASLAMLVPVISRGLREPGAELVKKAATTAGNICALVVDARDILPFVPMILPGLTKAVNHSHPDVRAAAERAHASLLKGAGIVDQATIDALSKSTSQMSLNTMSDKGPAVAMPADVEVQKLVYALLEAGVSQGLVAKEEREYVSNLIVSIARDARGVGGLKGEMKEVIMPIIGEVLGVEEADVDATLDAVVKIVAELLHVESTIKEADYIVRIEGIILAFAGKVLLRQTNLLLERGKRYGLIGQNGMGKTTLLNRVAAGDIKGFPKDVSVYYIQHEILSEKAEGLVDFMMGQVPDGTKRETVVAALVDVGFTDAMMAKTVGELSGGWRMKLAFARSMLWNCDILLLDEPTNHLDKASVKWLQDKLCALAATVFVVSHDYDFLSEVLTNVVHIADGKLAYYDCGFREFQRLRPEIVSALPSPENTVLEAMGGGRKAEAAEKEAATAKEAAGNGTAPAEGEDKDKTKHAGSAMANIDKMDKPIVFPDPGRLDGIVGKRKTVMRISNVSFKYDSSDKAILTDATGALCLGSRVALVGKNGAGKTTMMKLMVGELDADNGSGEVWKHHNLRVSYIAQHSMHHLETALENTPLEYIQNRFYMGRDKEMGKMNSMYLTPEDKEAMQARGAIQAVVGRQSRGNKLWYEVNKVGRKETDTDWEPLVFIEKMAPHVLKLVKNYDEKLKADQSGMAIRPITREEVRKHLADFGIDEDLSFQKIKRMSGGQRSRLVIAAAMWSMPHLIALDEPTNYLDNDTLAALTMALKLFKGAVMTISHNKAFVSELCTEEWLVEGGGVEVRKLDDGKPKKFGKKKDEAKVEA